MVYTAAAGVPPQQVMPIQLDVGCNTAAVRDQPLYMGLQQVRAPVSASKPTTCTHTSPLKSLRACAIDTHVICCFALVHPLLNSNSATVQHKYTSARDADTYKGLYVSASLAQHA